MFTECGAGLTYRSDAVTVKSLFNLLGWKITTYRQTDTLLSHFIYKNKNSKLRDIFTYKFNNSKVLIKKNDQVRQQKCLYML